MADGPGSLGWPRCRCRPVGARHDDHVGARPLDPGDRVLDGARLADHGDVRRLLEKGLDAIAHDFMVIDKDHTEGRAAHSEPVFAKSGKTKLPVLLEGGPLSAAEGRHQP